MVIADRIEGHQIAYKYLADDDFDSFFETRRKALLHLIGEAMDKDVADPLGGQAPAPEDYQLDDEEPSDTDIDEVL